MIQVVCSPAAGEHGHRMCASACPFEEKESPHTRHTSHDAQHHVIAGVFEVFYSVLGTRLW